MPLLNFLLEDLSSYEFCEFHISIEEDNPPDDEFNEYEEFQNSQNSIENINFNCELVESHFAGHNCK